MFDVTLKDFAHHYDGARFSALTTSWIIIFPARVTLNLGITVSVVVLDTLKSAAYSLLSITPLVSSS